MSEFPNGNYAVFGGTSGAGLAVASALLDLGAKVLVLCRNPAKLESLRGTTRERGPLWGATAAFFTNEGLDLPEAIRLLQGPDPLDGLFFSAAAPVFSPLSTTSAVGGVALSRALEEVTAVGHILRALTTRGAVKKEFSAVLMSSSAAIQGVPGLSAYSAAKAAIEALVRSAAVELAPRGIRVNCVRAAAFESPLHDRMTRGLPDSSLKSYRDAHPLGFGQTADIKEAVMFLLSQNSRWITGTSMAVDGGYSAKAR